MLKNKIYNYLSFEIFKNFITILLTFTAIAWTVRAVNFLDLLIEDGYSASIYFKYSLLNIFAIVTKFVPLAFLLSLIISISKFERQQELLILWTTGLNKIKITNIFFFISICIVFFQIIINIFINPWTLNESRTLLRDTTKEIDAVIKINDFSDTFNGVTFFVDKKNSIGELENIFINDKIGSLTSLTGNEKNTKNTTIFAKKGLVSKNKLILYNGTVQTLDKENEIKNIIFEKTELSTTGFNSRTITQPKIQETSTYELVNCITNNFNNNCRFKNNKNIVIENLSRRLGMPLYIPLISLIASFLLIYEKEKKYNFLKKYYIFSSAFFILVCSEILLKYSGFSLRNFIIYFFSPIIFTIILYPVLIKIMSAKTIT
ncbi:LptF/LptG family permease [Pelagibacteraceae bacterium]|nr:LptF/LptG family permease [Pelagibacteraceae bacterium]